MGGKKGEEKEVKGINRWKKKHVRLKSYVIKKKRTTTSEKEGKSSC